MISSTVGELPTKLKVAYTAFYKGDPTFQLMVINPAISPLSVIGSAEAQPPVFIYYNPLDN